MILFLMKRRISTLSGANRFRLGSYINLFPAMENKRSEGTDVGGAERYHSFDSAGYLSLLLFHISCTMYFESSEDTEKKKTPNR